MLSRPVVVFLLLWIAVGAVLRMGDYWFDFGVFVILVALIAPRPAKRP